MVTLCGFPDLPIQQAFACILKEQRKYCSCAEAIQEEIEATKKDKGDKFKMHLCTMEGHEHLGLPVLMVTYGL